MLGDITCDSDGKVDQFIDRRDVKRTLPLHAFDGEPYYLGVFLVGAYQEILGDLHNLLGDTHAVHVSLDATGEVVLDAVIKGDTVREVLDYVEFDAEALVAKLRADVETAVRAGRLDYEESGRLLQFYEDGLQRLHLPGRAPAAPLSQYHETHEESGTKFTKTNMFLGFVSFVVRRSTSAVDRGRHRGRGRDRSSSRASRKCCGSKNGRSASVKANTKNWFGLSPLPIGGDSVARKSLSLPRIERVFGHGLMRHRVGVGEVRPKGNALELRRNLGRIEIRRRRGQRADDVEEQGLGHRERRDVGDRRGGRAGEPGDVADVVGELEVDDDRAS